MSNLALNRTVAACYENGSTNIPLPKSFKTTINVDKWRAKYEDAEKKRKGLISQQERAGRDHSELEKKFRHLTLQNTVISSELADKSEQLQRLRTVSQNLYKEYDTLKNQYDLETGVMHQALSEASGWYRQNQELKRKSTLLLGASLTDVVDIGDGDTDQNELEGLRDSIKELSGQNARLQTELNEAKLSEFEATEQVVNLTQEVDELEKKCKALEENLKDLANTNEQMVRVSKLMNDELHELRIAEDKRKEETVTLRQQADSARKERNVLAHQSTLLLQGIAHDDDKVQFLQEIENLKRQLEDMTNKYERDIAHLQEKIEEHENDSQVEILEERLKIVESELQRTQEKAERLENQSKMSPPPPPPPPPPPLPPVAIAKPIIITTTKKIPFQYRPDEMDIKMLINDDDVTKSPVVLRKLAPQPAIDDLVNQIKGGKFTLKSSHKGNNKKEREEPEADRKSVV